MCIINNNKINVKKTIDLYKYNLFGLDENKQLKKCEQSFFI